MNLPKQTRRLFCTHGCRALSLVALGGALSSLLEGCGGGSPTSANSASPLSVVNGTIANGAIVVQIDASSPLSAVGAAALVRSSAGDVLVAHTAQNSFTALSAVCTHQACEITGFANSVFVCPCHGSQFNTSGGVVTGPASSPLHQFQTQFGNDVLTISA
jgi:cytochrome b6-f complex iron-sulfur subunit